MRYAEIADSAVVQIIETAAALPAHKLRADLLPVVDVVPEFDQATHALGAETLAIEAARVVRSWEVDALPPPPVPASVTAPQARVALLRAGLLPTVEAMVAQLGANSELAIFWEYSVTYGREHPMLLQMAAGLGLTSEQVDYLFRAAAAIQS